MGFRDLFGLDQNGRDSVDKHRFYIAVPEHKIAWDDFSGSTLSSAFSIYTQYQIHTSEQHGLSLGAMLYYNQNGLLRFHRFEQAKQLNYTYQRDAHRIYGLVGVVHHNSATGTLPTKNRPSLWLRVMSSNSIPSTTCLNLFILSGHCGKPKELEKPATEYVLGYRYVMPSSALELALTENVFSTDNSTDIALHISYRYRL